MITDLDRYRADVLRDAIARCTRAEESEVIARLLARWRAEDERRAA